MPDMMDPSVVVDLFYQAAEANLNSSLRKGGTVRLPDQGKLIATGDLHDHLPNLKRILHLAKLDESPEHHLILHEIIHGPNLINGMDTSVRTLARIAGLKSDYPDQLHLVQANHELAQLTGASISKHGVSLTDAFDRGVDYLYRDESREVRTAVKRFLVTLPLAARTHTGLLFAHSLPSPHHVGGFDYSLIHRVPTPADLRPHGPVHHMVWGRHHDAETARIMSEQWDANLFILGHQPAEMGYYTEADRILVLASNHNHGVALPIDLARTYTMDDLTTDVVPLAGVIVE